MDRKRHTQPPRRAEDPSPAHGTSYWQLYISSCGKAPLLVSWQHPCPPGSFEGFKIISSWLQTKPYAPTTRCRRTRSDSSWQKPWILIIITTYGESYLLSDSEHAPNHRHQIRLRQPPMFSFFHPFPLLYLLIHEAVWLRHHLAQKYIICYYYRVQGQDTHTHTHTHTQSIIKDFPLLHIPTIILPALNTNAPSHRFRSAVRRTRMEKRAATDQQPTRAVLLLMAT